MVNNRWSAFGDTNHGERQFRLPLVVELRVHHQDAAVNRSPGGRGGEAGIVQVLRQRPGGQIICEFDDSDLTVAHHVEGVADEGEPVATREARTLPRLFERDRPHLAAGDLDAVQRSGVGLHHQEVHAVIAGDDPVGVEAFDIGEIGALE